MFEQLNPVTARRQRWVRWSSLAAHGLVLAWMLHSPEPLKLQPNSISNGRNGTSVTRLYWSSKNPDNSNFSSPDSATQRYRKQRLSHDKLTYKSPIELAKVAPQAPVTRAEAEDASKSQTLSALGHGAQAGRAYGTLGGAYYFGDEIRPALAVKTSDPIVYPWQLPDAPGNEVIEVTIDERGEIVNKKVLQSLGTDIDNKCLAALENWHFQPATKNGAPIPSKQDTVFPFKARG